MSRYTIPAIIPYITVVVGWDNPLETFFAQVTREPDGEDESDPIVFWIGAFPGEVRAAEDLAKPLASYATLSDDMVAQLRADYIACLDRAPTRLQRTLLARMEVKP